MLFGIWPSAAVVFEVQSLTDSQVGSSFYSDVKAWDASLKEVLGHHRGLQSKGGVDMFCTHHTGDDIFFTDALIEVTVLPLVFKEK